MSDFKLHEASGSEILTAIENQVGFIPNVFAVLGGNRKALEAFATINSLFAETNLSAIEREIVQIAASVKNGCAYCVAGHSAFAHMQMLEMSQIAAIRDGEPLTDSRHEALRLFVQALVTSKGRGVQAELQAFFAAGYSHEQLFDVVLGVNIKMFSNHVAGLTQLPLDDAFIPFRWVPGEQANRAA